VTTERDVKKAYASPSLKKWGSVKDLTLITKKGKYEEVGGSFPGDT
jgi:hypothetical protein